MSPKASSAPVFRAMRADDLDTVTAIERDVHNHPWTHGNFSDSLNAGYGCVVCEQGGVLVGYGVLMMAPDEAHLLNISVARACQRRGLGQALLDYFIGEARRRGAQTLFLEVRPSNTAALGLYVRAGFNEFSTRTGYYPAAQGREDAVLMGLAL